MPTERLLSIAKAAHANGDLGPGVRLDFGPTVRSFTREVWWDIAVHLTDGTASLFVRADHIFGGYRWAVRVDGEWIQVTNSHDGGLAIESGLAWLRAPR